jgi:hypothetical protein
MCQRIAIEDNIRVDAVDCVPLCFVLGFFVVVVMMRPNIKLFNRIHGRALFNV